MYNSITSYAQFIDIQSDYLHPVYKVQKLKRFLELHLSYLFFFFTLFP